MELSWRLLHMISTGIATTLLVSVVGALCGFPLALAILALRRSSLKIFKAVAILYVSLIRGTPALLQVLVAYYVIPSAVGMNLPPIAAGVLALALNTAAFTSEALRGALATVSEGQRGAAKALGMNAYLAWRHVILPQVVYRALPPLTSEFGSLLKATSLLSVIAVSEMSAVSRELSDTTHLPLLVYSLTALVYFFILLVVSLLSRRLEAKVARFLPNSA